MDGRTSLYIPVFTLKGKSSVGRVTPAILTAIGLDDWIVDNGDDYIAMAVEWAVLQKLRANLRTRVSELEVGDLSRYTRAVVHTYRTM